MDRQAPSRQPLGLTQRQRQGYAFIRTGIEAGRPPSYAEICRHLGIVSKGNAHRLVACLVERGYLVHVSRRPRSLALSAAVPSAEDEPAGPVVTLAGRLGRAVVRQARQEGQPVEECVAALLAAGLQAREVP